MASRLAVALTGIILSTVSAQAKDAQLCIDRPGENGRVNITPVTILVKGYAALTINGEEEVCLRPHSDEDTTLSIRLRFPYPYWGAVGTPPYADSTSVSAKIKRGQTTELTLCQRQQNRNDPDWERSGWRKMWIFSPPEPPKACAD
ncbi:MAG TPA: hypothetical protein VGM17_16290 [Rhizomicrobium sp.]|jgi:hypothetical protein